MTIKCLVFDCDGVILDSVPVKTRAFARLAEPYGPEAEQKFVAFHAENGGVSRFRKFEWLHDNIIGRPITPEESEALGKKFAAYALDEVRKCAMIPGAIETLEKWHGKLPLYVCSGTPTAELRQVLEERQLAHFFDGIFGTPPEKAMVLAEIIRMQQDLKPEQALMIGDAMTDLKAARHAGARFYAVGRGLEGKWQPWSVDLVPLNTWLAAQ